MSLVTYKKYKDSEIEWLGDIPEHWEVKRNKQIFFELSDLKTTGKEMLLTVSHLTGVTPRSEKNVNMFMAESMEGYKRVREGDLIINTMWAWMGALGISNYNGICSPAYNIYRQQKKVNSNPKYFGYLFSTRNFVLEMTRRSKGIVESRLRLYPRDFYGIEICFPSELEQTQIANYLDTKTQAIDKKTELLKQKIDKYKELRKSLINQTITKGLNPSIEFKESGIEWVGKIPKHWEVKRLKELGEISTSSVNKKIEENESLVKIVNYTDVYNNVEKELRNRDDYMVVSAKPNQLLEKKLKKGDVLFTPSSETVEDIGVSSVVMEDLIKTLYSYHVLRLRFSLSVNDSFKKYMFNNDFVQYYFSKSAKGTTRKILGLNDFKNLIIVLPSDDEQKEIAKYLDTKTNLIDSIIANIENQIAGLTELRKTLINDVVTGKLKVTKDS